MQAGSALNSAPGAETSQTSKLLPSVFQRFENSQKISVLHIGPACTDTLDFFSTVPCHLYFVDLFSELPLQQAEEGPTDYRPELDQILQLPADRGFDVCMFWDLFNYLSSDAIGALMYVLAPHLWEDSVAHAFSVHNPKAAIEHNLYGIRDGATLSKRPRQQQPAGYAPHSQRQLAESLHCFDIERSVLLPDSRLELLLQAKSRPSK